MAGIEIETGNWKIEFFGVSDETATKLVTELVKPEKKKAKPKKAEPEKRGPGRPKKED